MTRIEREARRVLRGRGLPETPENVIEAMTLIADVVMGR